MNALDLITVVVPIYNGEKFLRDNIESILNQTYTHLEIICVCAGCTDASVVIMQKYAQLDARILIHVEKENHGPAYSRNLGMEMAQGEWIIFLDCDDLFELNMIEIMWRQAVKENADICCCFWDCFDNNIYGKPGMTNEKIKYLCHTYPVINVSQNRKFLFQLIAFNVWTKLVRKTVYKKRAVNFGNFLNCEDLYFSLMAVVEAEKMVYVDQVLVHYRINIGRDTQTTTMNREKSYEWEAADAVFEYIGNKEYGDELKQSFYNYICSQLYAYFWNAADSVYRQFFNELYVVYIEKWKMNNKNIAEKLSLFNREIYAYVRAGNVEMDVAEMIMQAKVQFVKRISEKKICAIWGCGYWGKMLLNRLNNAGIRVRYIFDSDHNKWGMCLFGQEVEPFQDNEVDCVIVTNSKYYEEIKRQIGMSVCIVYDLEKEIYKY